MGLWVRFSFNVDGAVANFVGVLHRIYKIFYVLPTDGSSPAPGMDARLCHDTYPRPHVPRALFVGDARA